MNTEKIEDGELMNLNCDLRRTEIRRKELKQYLDRYVLKEDEFRCEHCRECKHSARKGRFYEGQLPYLGKFYDLDMDGKPFRIVYVGQEMGRPNRHVSLKEIYKHHHSYAPSKTRFMKEPGFEFRNSCGRGITSALRLLFGKELGRDYESEFIKINGEHIHIFRCYALVNYLLCSALGKDGSAKGHATKTMKRNCQEHFINVMRILNPSVVIVSGTAFWPWVKEALEEAFDCIIPKGIMPKGRKHVFWARPELCVAAFTHPTAHGKDNWGNNDKTPYLRSTVKSSIKRILQHLSAESD